MKGDKKQFVFLHPDNKILFFQYFKICCKLRIALDFKIFFILIYSI